MGDHIWLRSIPRRRRGTPTKGRGIFGNISLADQATNPIRWFLNVHAAAPARCPCGPRTHGAWAPTTWGPAAFPGGPPTGLPDPQRAGLRTLLQRGDHELVHCDGRRPGGRPRSTRGPIRNPHRPERESQLLRRAGVRDGAILSPRSPCRPDVDHPMSEMRPPTCAACRRPMRRNRRFSQRL